jgi:parallel beta-helix repeat protein
MKSKLKKSASIIIVLGIFFAISSIYYSNPYLKATYRDKSADYSGDITLDRENLKISAVSEKIHIDNNWTAAKAAGICTGSGSYSDPYVIQNLEIDGEGWEYCIWIENSNVYFKIEKCSLFNSLSIWYGGIRLSNVNNSQIIDNNCYNNRQGIYVSGGYNNIISGNTLNNNTIGIVSSGNKHNVFSGNTIYDNNQQGILANGNEHNVFSGNTILNNEIGIYMYSEIGKINTGFNTISGNIINYNENYGIVIITRFREILQIIIMRMGYRYSRVRVTTFREIL